MMPLTLHCLLPIAMGLRAMVQMEHITNCNNKSRQRKELGENNTIQLQSLLGLISNVALKSSQGLPQAASDIKGTTNDDDAL
eukprot:7084217-Ditylum_brightwellii.AAC.1